MPEDAKIGLLTRTVGQGRIVDEFIFRLTDSVRMDWFAPRLEPTGRRLAAPHVTVITFENSLVASEYMYWDQATVLAQMGLLQGHLLVMGADRANRLLSADAPANQLIDEL